MTVATRSEVVKIFPGIDDHAVVEILATKPTIGELETASLLLADQDDELIEAKRDAGQKLNRLLSILTDSGIAPAEESD